jgi:predicted nucleotidyltransferase
MVYTIAELQRIITPIALKYRLRAVYLFGSYAKGKATAVSDIDLLISSGVTGLRFYELAERLREKLHKKIDLLDVKQLSENPDLIDEVLKEGIRVYG